MAGIQDLKFTIAEFTGKDISSLSDTPSADGMTAEQLKSRFDMIPKMMVALGNFNSLIDLLGGVNGASNISATDINGALTNIQAILNKLGINMNEDINQNLNDIIEELATKETKTMVAQLLLDKADRDLLNVSVANFTEAMKRSGWLEEIPNRLAVTENDVGFILDVLGLRDAGTGVNQPAMNGVAIRVNTVKLTTTWSGIPSESAYAIQYVSLPSITPNSNIIVSPTAGAYAYPNTPLQVPLEGNIKEYIDCGIHCSWSGVDELGVGSLMFACSKLTTKDIYVDIMELVNIGVISQTTPTAPSSNNHYHDITSIQGMTDYEALLDSKVSDVDTKIAGFDITVTNAQVDINSRATNAINTITAQQTATENAINTACSEAEARMAQYDGTVILQEVADINTKIGDTASLQTTSKILVGAINEVFQSGNSFKTDVAIAITEKGVPTNATDSKETFVANIGAIQTGSSARPMILEITTTTSNQNFEIPITAPYDVVISWGDGTADTTATSKVDGKVSVNHSYATAGTYEVTISGVCTTISYYFVSSRTLIKKVKQIGDLTANLYNAFSGCTGITDISGVRLDSPYLYKADSMFNGCTGITTVPQEIFKNCRVANLSNFFKGCTAITTIYGEMFVDSFASTLSSLFEGCTALTSIPAFFFKGLNLTGAQSYIFRNCNQITSLPADLFSGCSLFTNNGTYSIFTGTAISTIDSNVLRGYTGANVAYFFKGLTALTYAPVIWTDPQFTSYTQCFNGCTNASNYADIPTAWK